MVDQVVEGGPPRQADHHHDHVHCQQLPPSLLLTLPLAPTTIYYYYYYYYYYSLFMAEVAQPSEVGPEVGQEGLGSLLGLVLVLRGPGGAGQGDDLLEGLQLHQQPGQIDRMSQTSVV